jgi:hypothetical protein
MDLDGAVAQGVGRLGEGQAAVGVGIQRNLQRLEHGFGHEVGAAARAAGTDAAALDLFDVGDAAGLEGDHLQQIGIHDRHGENVVLLAAEFARSGKAGFGHIAHDLADHGFSLVGQFDVFNTGSGDLGHGFDPLDVLGPYFGHTPAIGIIDTARPAGADADEFGLGGQGTRKGQNHAQRQNKKKSFHMPYPPLHPVNSRGESSA